MDELGPGGRIALGTARIGGGFATQDPASSKRHSEPEQTQVIDTLDGHKTCRHPRQRSHNAPEHSSAPRRGRHSLRLRQGTRPAPAAG